MSVKVNISDSEWKVMEVVWKNPGIVIGKIRTALEENDWSYSTIKTLVIRLVKKEALRAEDSDMGKRYYAAISEQEAKRYETQNFIEKLYEGSIRRMVSNLVEDSSLSQKDVDDLMKLIDKLEN